MGSVQEIEKADEAVLFGDPVSVKLGGVSYDIPRLKMGAARKWRKDHGTPLLQAAAKVMEDLTKAQSSGASIQLSSLAQSVSWLVLNSFDEAFNAVCAYAPSISADRARIEEAAYDEEVIDALIAVLKLSFPLGKAASALGLAFAKTAGQPQPSQKTSEPAPAKEAYPPRMSSP